MWRGYVIHQLLYILHYAILCVYALSYYDIWPWIITSYTILIYYNNYYYDNSNYYLFLLFIFIFIIMFCICVACMCCAVLSLVSVCSLVCPRICSYMCICVCLPRITLPDRAVVKRLMCWYRGVYFGKKFLQNLENGYTT